MRILSLLVLGVLLVPSVHAQVDDDVFFELVREVTAPASAVQTNAEAVAKSHGYDVGHVPAGDPTLLVAGDLYLRIQNVPFTLYVRTVKLQTEMTLESRQLDVSEDVRHAAEAFLRDVAERSSLERG